MAANTTPIYTKAGLCSTDGTSTTSSVMNSGITAAAADTDGTNANNRVIWTATVEGGLGGPIRFVAKGTNVATVARIYINNGGSAATSANNAFVGNISLPATTASSTAALAELEYVGLIGVPIPTGFRILVGLGTAVASGWVATHFGATY